MGANFNTINLKGERPDILGAFRGIQDDDRYENGHSYSGGFGMTTGLSFIEKSFASDDDADEWLIENCQKWEDALAVFVNDHYRIGAWCSS